MDQRFIEPEKVHKMSQDLETVEKEFLERELLNNIMVLNLAYQDLPNFKAERKKRYEKVLKQTAFLQGQVC